ncbi:unnamed protein product [Cyprideis torosa]|uniref:Uncharacterized protein n=1 Tax=Cyprideis torosa TaxID=163714 RepID=A0A7R8WT32_9CRUS|nr:unnamed protein product [Cyprideis torosa]CAG0908662.1 unnamed protein product [Cyprideis torosa]
MGRVLAEFVPGGGIVPSWRMDGIRLLQYHTSFGLFVLVCEGVFCLFTLHFTFKFLQNICKQGKRFFHSYWSYVEAFSLVISYSAVALYVLRTIEANRIAEKFQETHGNGYIRMQYVAIIDEAFGYLVAILTFTATISFLKLLRFNRRIGVLSATMRQCYNDLWGYAVVFIVLFNAFCMMFFLLLNKNLPEWRNYVSAFESCFSAMLGKFDFYSMRQVHILAGVIFFFFAISMSFIMINILLTIIIKAFEQVRWFSLATATQQRPRPGTFNKNRVSKLEAGNIQQE